MFALIVDDFDPAGAPAKVVRELFANNPELHFGLDVRSVSENVAVGWIANEDGSFSAYVAPALTKADLKKYAADVRFQKETGGIFINGSTIATDRESQAMVSGAFNYVTVNPAATIQYKTETGFVTLDAAAVTAIASAVAAHVQRCFAKEASTDAAIDAGTMTTKTDIDAAFASAL